MLRFLAVLLLLVPLFAHAQGADRAEVVATCGTPNSTYSAGQPAPLTQGTDGKACVNAAVSVSASVTGFDPTSTGTPISVTTGGNTGTLPAGTVVVASNVGATNGAYCKLGGSATTSDQLIPPNSWFAFTVGGATQLTCITSTSTTTVNMVGGSGLPTGAGGGGGGSGGSVTQGTTPWVDNVTQLGGTNIDTNSGNKSAGTMRVVIATDQPTMSNAQPVSVASLPLPSGAATSANQSSQITQETATATALGAPADSVCGTATGTCSLEALIKFLNNAATSAIPAGTNLIGKVGIDQTTPGTTNGVQVNAALPAGTNLLGKTGIDQTTPGTTNAVSPQVNVGGTQTGQIGCGSSVVYDASTNGSTQLVALASGQKVYVCGYSILAAGTVNVELDYGTGTACATGNNKMTPAYQLTAQVGLVDGSPFYRGLSTAASNELCIKTSAGVAVQAVVYYTQF